MYVAVPAIGVLVIEQLRGGATLGDAGRVASAVADEDVDVLDFGTR